MARRKIESTSQTYGQLAFGVSDEEEDQRPINPQQARLSFSRPPSIARLRGRNNDRNRTSRSSVGEETAPQSKNKNVNDSTEPTEDTVVSVQTSSKNRTKSTSSKRKDITSAVISAANNRTLITSKEDEKEDKEEKKEVDDTLSSVFSPSLKKSLDKIFVFGSNSKSKSEIREVLNESKKIDLLISLRSKDSEILNFNAIKTPELVSSYVYNFFEPNEDNILQAENPDKDPLAARRLKQVPRYVELEWNPSRVTDPVELKEVKENNNKKELRQLRDNIFKKPSGVISSRSKISTKKDKTTQKTTPTNTSRKCDFAENNRSF